jgi:hypothetical protein
VIYKAGCLGLSKVLVALDRSRLGYVSPYHGICMDVAGVSLPPGCCDACSDAEDPMSQVDTVVTRVVAKDVYDKTDKAVGGVP